jgi:hypothetical protein
MLWCSREWHWCIDFDIRILRLWWNRWTVLGIVSYKSMIFGGQFCWAGCEYFDWYLTLANAYYRAGVAYLYRIAALCSFLGMVAAIEYVIYWRGMVWLSVGFYRYLRVMLFFYRRKAHSCCVIAFCCGWRGVVNLFSFHMNVYQENRSLFEGNRKRAVDNAPH